MAAVRIVVIGLAASAFFSVGCDDEETAVAQAPTAPKVVTFGDAPDCGRIDISRDAYGTDIEPSDGGPGSRITMSGTTLRGEDGRWAPSDRLEVWWNTEVPDGLPIADGPVVRLARVDEMDSCRFEATFSVPDVEPGRYQISVFVWDEDPEDGYGYFLPHRFTVTSR